MAKLLQERIVYVGGDITPTLAQAVIAQLTALQQADSERPITLAVDSPGGSFPATLTILQCIQNLSLEVGTLVLKRADYAAALLVGAGARGKRVARPEAQMTIGPPPFANTGQDFQAYLQAMRVHTETFQEALASVSGQSLARIQAIAEPLTLGVQQAMEFGLLDRSA